MSLISSGEIALKGVAAAEGIAIGDIALINLKQTPVQPVSIKESEIELELEKYRNAREKLCNELKQLKSDVDSGDSIDLIETQIQIAQDPEVEKTITALIEEHLMNADFAIYQSYSEFIEKLKESGSDLFRQRIIDLEDVRDQLIGIINDSLGKNPVKEGSVLIASDLSPAELLNYYDQGIQGIIMDKGGKTSHAAIISRSLGIPCIVSAKEAVKTAGRCKQVILDGNSGEIYFNPDKKRIKTYQKLLKNLQKKASGKKENAVFETLDGFPFRLLSNIEFEKELPRLQDSGAKGVGLLRTECLLFGKQPRLKAAEQLVFYTTILEGTKGPVTIRLFDVGGDKLVNSNTESNPFLGWRGIRMLLDEKELLDNQLSAILQAAGKFPGRIQILVPMVSVIEEIVQIRKEVERIQSALLSSGRAIDEKVPLGLMVEVPSVAVSSYHFAKEVDFLSLGTNDLTQYTLAVDRGNERISSLFQHYHPSVLKLIQMTVDGAAKADVEVRACGELAGAEIGAAFLFGLGIRELSMSPASIAKIKDLLTSRSKKDFEKLAADILKASTSEQVEQLFNNWKKID